MNASQVSKDEMFIGQSQNFAAAGQEIKKQIKSSRVLEGICNNHLPIQFKKFEFKFVTDLKLPT